MIESTRSTVKYMDVSLPAFLQSILTPSKYFYWTGELVHFLSLINQNQGNSSKLKNSFVPFNFFQLSFKKLSFREAGGKFKS